MLVKSYYLYNRYHLDSSYIKAGIDLYNEIKSDYSLFNLDIKDVYKIKTWHYNGKDATLDFYTTDYIYSVVLNNIPCEDYYLNHLPAILTEIFGRSIINDDFYNLHYSLFEE